MAPLIVPKLVGANLERGKGAAVWIDVKNIGGETGEFKLIGWIYKNTGPYLSSGRGAQGNAYHSQIWSWVDTYGPKGGVGADLGIDEPWYQLSPGASRSFVAPTRYAILWSGTSHLFLLCAVRRPGTTTRLYDQEHYKFYPNYVYVS